MEASTTIKQMLAGNRIFVPTYQRAYSWDTEFEKSKFAKTGKCFFIGLGRLQQEFNKIILLLRTLSI
jgi:hypothetical protein